MRFAAPRCSRVSIRSCGVQRYDPRSDLAVRLATPRCSRVSIRSCGVQRYNPRSDLAVRLAPLRCSRVSLRSCGGQRCGPRSCAAPRRPMLPHPVPLFANRSLDYPLATPRCPAGRPRRTSVSRPSPTASWGAIVHYVVVFSAHCNIACLARLAPVSRGAKIRPGLLGRVAASSVARAAGRIRK